mmetsp:Transcript_16428/g.53612  ORF Transcript_16428/g.53612 Transcript_16428/m.53612 type:complete len:310 (+) Transcript_16428:671-1600(+)
MAACFAASLGPTMEMEDPAAPARAVRPARCTKSFSVAATSKWTTVRTPLTSSPRAATSVATSTPRASPAKRSTALRRARCCIAACKLATPGTFKSLSAVARRRVDAMAFVKTTARPRSPRCRIAKSAPSFSASTTFSADTSRPAGSASFSGSAAGASASAAASAGAPPAVVRSTTSSAPRLGDRSGATRSRSPAPSTSPRSLRFLRNFSFLPRASFFSASVAENTNVCQRFFGLGFAGSSIRYAAASFASSSKAPGSSMRSASSSTRKRHAESVTRPRSRKSTRRPGVASKRSQPRSSSWSWPRVSAPP